MARKIMLILGVMAIGTVGIFLYYNWPSLPFSGASTVCTQEVKQCPDGSFVGRSGRGCQFAKCPASADDQEDEAGFVPFTSEFEIFTHRTPRTFDRAMYHHQSPDVYITAENPAQVHVQKPGVTWGEFFDSLPFSLTESCLVTGTEQEFCTNDQYRLRFYLNDLDTPDALEMEIHPRDTLIIKYE